MLKQILGPCENDIDCPPNLYCLQNDCWAIPEKPLRNFQALNKNFLDALNKSENSLNQIPKLFAVQHDKKIYIPQKETLFPLESFDDDGNEKNKELDNLEVHPPGRQPQEISTKSPAEIAKSLEKELIQERSFEKLDDNLENQKISLSLNQIQKNFYPSNILLPSNIQQQSLTNLPILSTTFATISRSFSPKPNLFEEKGWIEMNITRKSQNFSTTSNLKKIIATTQLANFDIMQNKFKEQGPLKNMILSSSTIQREKKIFYNYSRQNRIQRPVRVEMYNAIGLIHHECDRHADCGNRHYLCCKKRWCDLSMHCGSARFCLPDCQLTKMTYLNGAGVETEDSKNSLLTPFLDLVYD